MTNNRRDPVETLWTYAYQIEPPQVEGHFRSVLRLLDDEQVQARRGAHRWVGRVITEERVTHILVVSNSPEHSRDINDRLETELRKLRVGFSISAPLQVGDDATRPPPGGDDPD
jgi:hypothetical protein